MSHESTLSGDAQSSERRFEGPVKPWEGLFLIAFAAAILLAVVWQSNKQYFNNDELLTALLVSNPSFSQMWQTIRHGGELNPPLFFVMEWLVAHTLGTSELALRAISGVSVALAGWILFFAMRPLTGPRISALAVALVLGLSRDVFIYEYTARYYGLLLMLVAWAAFLALRVSHTRPARKRDYLCIFIAHCALPYLHLYGLLYSGVILAAMLAGDWLRRTPQWKVYAAVLAAWLSFAAWIPSMRQQLKSVSGGVFVPPGMLDLGFFMEQLALQTPLAVVFLLVTMLGALALITSRSNLITEEVTQCSAPIGWAALALAAMALMTVPITTWIASHKMYPPPYMLRYMFPCIAAWVFIVALVMVGLHKLPRPSLVSRITMPPWLSTLAWCCVLLFCLGFQPMRARKNLNARAASYFEDEDFGYRDLPIVFENSWYYLQRAWYGKGREYVLLIDHEAAEADPGWYTKNMEREFSHFSPHYGKGVFLHPKELPEWPNGFLAVDDDYTKTFEWVFAHHPEWKTKLLGSRNTGHPIFGEQRVYLVQKK